MNVKSVPVAVNGKSRLAVHVYRVLNSTVFYLGQPLTAVAAIIGPIIIKRHQAAHQWAFLLVSSALTFAMVYMAAKLGQTRSRAYLVERGLFDEAEDRPTV